MFCDKGKHNLCLLNMKLNILRTKHVKHGCITEKKISFTLLFSCAEQNLVHFISIIEVNEQNASNKYELNPTFIIINPMRSKSLT